MPLYEGEHRTVFCKTMGWPVRQVGRYHPDGELRWWCAHRKASKERIIVSRRAAVK